MAQGNTLQDRLVAAVEPVVTAQGLELVEVAWQRESGRQFLRIFVDKPDGVTLDDCAALSRALDEPLEALQLDTYYLEVSSPGAERPLKTERDYERFQGRLVHLKLSQPVAGSKTLEGRLLGHDAETLRLSVQGQDLTVPRSHVSAARLALVMPGPEDKLEGGHRVVEL
jgi:ribosome maturation factor RimP